MNAVLSADEMLDSLGIDNEYFAEQVREHIRILEQTIENLREELDDHKTAIAKWRDMYDGLLQTLERSKA